MRIPKGGIAFFDSGIGGLTVLTECKKYLPNEIFYYYGDNAHAPYGNLPPKKIKKLVFRIFRRLEKLKVAAAVVACNTATAVCIEELREKFSFPIIGTEPALLPAAAKGGEVFVLSTRATYNSVRFHKLCALANTLYPNTRIKAYACDGLAGEIEKHLGEPQFDVTSALPVGTPTTVVLGCTHYVYVAEQIQRFYGCQVVDGNRGIALRLCSVLQQKSTKTFDFVHPRPPIDRFRPQTGTRMPVFEGAEGVKGKCRKANKRSRFIDAKLGNKKNSAFLGQIFFLGGRKNQNKKRYKQMFARKVVF